MTEPIDTLITAEENRCMFDRISRHYDVMNRFMSLGQDRRWRRTAVRQLAPVAGRRYIDLGTGTGEIALEIVRQAPGALVVGIDPAPEMLKIARLKAARAGQTDAISFQEGAASNPALEPDSMDGVISAFCFRNIENRTEAMQEMRRVLRPDASLVILELVHPTNRLIRLGYHVYIPLINWVGRFVDSRSAYRYLLDSIAAFPRPDSVLALLRDTGFVNARCRPMMGGVVAIFRAEKG